MDIIFKPILKNKKSVSKIVIKILPLDVALLNNNNDNNNKIWQLTQQS